MAKDTDGAGFGIGNESRLNHDWVFRVSVRCYEASVRFYPPEFRQEFAEELHQFFRQRCSDAAKSGRRAGLLRVSLAAIPDIIMTAIRERMRMRNNLPSDRSFELLKACTLGVLAGALLFMAVAILFHIGTVAATAVFYGALGLTVGVAQTRVPRNSMRSSAEWIAASVAASIGGSALLRFVPSGNLLHRSFTPIAEIAVVLFAILAGSGIFSACMQWISSRQKSPRSLIWIPVSTIGILAPAFVTTALIGQGAIFGSTVYAAIAALPLQWIMKSLRQWNLRGSKSTWVE
jgi:hypothetical protein